MEYILTAVMTSMAWVIAYLLLERKKGYKSLSEAEKPTEEELKDIKRREDHFNALLEYDVSRAYGVRK
jgi:hypothetical protein